MHSDFRATREGRRPRSSRTNSGRRNCLPFSGRGTDTIGDAAAIETRLRINRAPRRCSGGPGLARSTLGLDLLLPRRPLFHEVAATHSLPRHRGLWRTACGQGCHDCDRARRVAQAGRRMLSATASAEAAPGSSVSGGIEALAFFNSDRRGHRRNEIEPRQIARDLCCA